MILALQIILGLSATVIIALLVRSLSEDVHPEEVELPSIKELTSSALDWLKQALQAFRHGLLLFFGGVLHFLHKVFQGISALLSFSSSKMKERVEGKKKEESFIDED